MKTLSKVGVGILVGYLLSKSLTPEDFQIIRKKLLDQSKKIEPKLSSYFYELNNILKNDDAMLDIEVENKKILLQLQKIEEELEAVKSEEIANLILDNLEDDEEKK